MMRQIKYVCPAKVPENVTVSTAREEYQQCQEVDQCYSAKEGRGFG